jgi:hypothetical protein
MPRRALTGQLRKLRPWPLVTSPRAIDTASIDTTPLAGGQARLPAQLSLSARGRRAGRRLLGSISRGQAGSGAFDQYAKRRNRLGFNLDLDVKEERPLHSAFNPWDRITDVESVRRLLRDGGATNVEVTAEDGIQPLRSAEDWWIIALGSGLRWTIEQMGPQAAARVKDDNVHWLDENKVGSVETNAIYAIGHKPS